MRPCSAALTTFLANPANKLVIQVDLYTVLLATGETFRWTGGDSALTVPSAGFPAGSINAGADRSFTLGPRFGRSKVSTKVGVEAAELDVEIFASADDLMGSLSIAQAATLGLFDGATIELDRFFAPPLPNGAGDFDTSLGCMIWFYGRVADVDVGRSVVTLKVKSLMNLLALQQIPRRLYQATCGHIFGDVMCGYDRTAGENALGAATGVGLGSVTALAGSNQSQIVTSFFPGTATAYNNGTITATSGANLGASRGISSLAAGTAYLKRPFLSTVTIGDTFDLLPGCDHTLGTCDATFNNRLRYGGFAYIPPPENAI